MWSDIIAKKLPSEIAWKALEFHREIMTVYNSTVEDQRRPSLYAWATRHFKVECTSMPGLDRPMLITVSGNPAVIVPDVMTKRCFDRHMDIQMTWYFLCGLFDGLVRAFDIEKPANYPGDNERFTRELAKYAAELCLYGTRQEFTEWVKENGLHRIHEFHGHPYSIFGFYLAKCQPGVTAVAYSLDGVKVASADPAHPCDVPCEEDFPTQGRIIHQIGPDRAVAEKLILECGLTYSEHTEMFHKHVDSEDEEGNKIGAELISYLMGRPLSTQNQAFYLTRRTVALLIPCNDDSLGQLQMATA